MRRQQRVELAEELLLHALVLDDRLDGEVGAGAVLERSRPAGSGRAPPSRSAAASFPFSTSFAEGRPELLDGPAGRAPPTRRRARTESPACAATCAIPEPICPAPTTAIRSMAIRDSRADRADAVPAVVMSAPSLSRTGPGRRDLRRGPPAAERPFPESHRGAYTGRKSARRRGDSGRSRSPKSYPARVDAAHASSRDGPSRRWR